VSGARDSIMMGLDGSFAVGDWKRYVGSVTLGISQAQRDSIGIVGQVEVFAKG